MLSSDPHWNPSNMVYGDDPLQLNEYTYAPNVYAIRQSGNLYAYCMNNPLMFVDPTGNNAAVLQWVPSLSGALPWLAGGIATGMAGIKTAIATSWMPVVAVGAATVAAGAIGVVVYQAATYVADAEQAKTWVTAVVSQGGVDNLRGNTVYVMVEKSTGNVWYVGLTSDYSGRKQAHQGGSNPKFDAITYNMIPVATNLTRKEGRALEQSLITAYTLESLANMINSISPSKWSNFTYEFERAGSLISGYYTD